MSLYLALGDSITTGYGVGLQSSFASLLYAQLKQYHPGLSYRNLAADGLTTGQLNALLTTAPLVACLQQATLITITTGSNDLLDSIPILTSGPKHLQKNLIRSLEANLDSIGRQLRFLNRQATIKIAGLYNPLPLTQYAGYANLAQSLIDGFNNNVSRWAKRYQADFIPLDPVFRGREASVLGPDKLHPSRYGHFLIAQSFLHINTNLRLNAL